MPFARMNNEEIPLFQKRGFVRMYVFETARSDDHKFRELVVMHGYECVAWRVPHFAHDAWETTLLEIGLVTQFLQMSYSLE